MTARGSGNDEQKSERAGLAGEDPMRTVAGTEAEGPWPGFWREPTEPGEGAVEEEEAAATLTGPKVPRLSEQFWP